MVLTEKKQLQIINEVGKVAVIFSVFFSIVHICSHCAKKCSTQARYTTKLAFTAQKCLDTEWMV